jgi:DnaJ-class molecular chaperone
VETASLSGLAVSFGPSFRVSPDAPDGLAAALGCSGVTADNGVETRLVPCENCGGTGFVRASGLLGRLMGLGTTLCKVCDGVGKEEKPASN